MAEVLEFKPGARPVAVKPRDPAACRHGAVIVDDVLRRVNCARCNEQLDPIQVLLEMSRTWDAAAYLAERLERRDAATEEAPFQKPGRRLPKKP